VPCSAACQPLPASHATPISLATPQHAADIFRRSQAMSLTQLRFSESVQSGGLQLGKCPERVITYFVAWRVNPRAHRHAAAGLWCSHEIPTAKCDIVTVPAPESSSSISMGYHTAGRLRDLPCKDPVILRASGASFKTCRVLCRQSGRTFERRIYCHFKKARGPYRSIDRFLV